MSFITFYSDNLTIKNIYALCLHIIFFRNIPVHIKKDKYFEIIYIIKLQQISDFYDRFFKHFLSHKSYPNNYKRKKKSPTSVKPFSIYDFSYMRPLIFIYIIKLNLYCCNK